MKLLLENWREFVTEDRKADLKNALKTHGLRGDSVDATATHTPPPKPKRIIAPKLEEIMEDRGFYVNRFIDEGKYGKIWELEGSNSGRRLAMKVVSVLLAGQQVDREEENYRWILENRASLPAEVKDYIVNVYSVDRIPGKDLVDVKGQPYQMESGALVIVMELLEPAPKQVVNDLLARGKDDPLASHKEARIFKDEGAVYELVQNLVLRIDGYMAAAVDGYSRADAQRLIKSVTQAFFSGDDSAARKNMFVDYGQIRYLAYSDFEPRHRLLNILFNKVDAEIPEENEYRVSILQSAAQELDDKAHYYLQKQVVPIHQRVHPHAPAGHAGTRTQEAFPEAAGLLSAMEYLHGKKWSPGDVHHKNVMARPQSGQLVIVDVGLFKKV
jgi:serine/threonine protein kinase